MKRYKKSILIVGVILVLLVSGGYALLRNTLNEFHERNIDIADIGDNPFKTEEDTAYIDEEEDKESDTQQEDDDKIVDSLDDNSNNESEQDESSEIDKNEDISEYLKMIRESDRINILCLGVASYNLADTMIVASFDPKAKHLDLISIPRDTYLYRDGYDEPGQKKINASYVGRNSAARAQSSMNAVRDLLNIPIHHFVKVEYEGVEKVVDALGGVEVFIPFDMDYDDPVDNLHIHFKQGKKLLYGEDAVKFLRFRQNNDNSHSDGDLGRIKRQQQFILNALNKSMSLEIFGVIDAAKNHIRTSLTVEEMLSYANKLRQVNQDNIKSYTLPGEAKMKEGLSFYLHDENKTKELITQIYNR